MNVKNFQQTELENIYGKLSPFELKNNLIHLAQEESRKSTHALLDAGRGNPNWIAASPREAYFAFGQFAVMEARKTWNNGDLAGMPMKFKIADSFREYIHHHLNEPGIKLLKEIIDYGIKFHEFNEEQWIYELTDGIIGDNYPFPERMLFHVEKVINDYLKKELYLESDSLKFDSFAVEGATAGICYIFDSLIANNLLHKKDTIAIMTPIFTPYLEIPVIPRYEFNIVNIMASETACYNNITWQYPEGELMKLADTNIKALFLVNPSNPPSVAMEPESIEKLSSVIEKYNPNLMIISDDVYGTFVDNFKSIFSCLSFNTIGVYSFSKYFGVTGWRLGTISMAEENVFDYLLSRQNGSEKERALKRYGALSTNPENIKFIDRIAADSRQVALKHTAGLSTPQQVQMAFLAIFSLLDKGNTYKELTKNICRRRKKMLFQSLGLNIDANPYSASYYTEFDLLEWSLNLYGKNFTDFLKKNYKPIDILFSLAKKSSIVLLSGSGFQAPEWSIRISLANLHDASYLKIGKVLKDIMEEYVIQWKKSI